MNRQVAGLDIDVDQEGYLTDFSQWTREVALALAREADIEMTDQHWAVIDFLQDSHRQQTPLSIRSLGKRGPVSIKEFYALFPDGPLKKASKIAGIPKPASCV